MPSPLVSPRVITIGLRATAVLNLVAGLSSALAPDLHAKMMLAGDVAMTGLLLRYHVILWLFVAAAGVGYALAARDPSGQRALVVSGAIGKLCVAGAWTEMLASGYGTPLMIGGVAWDGVLGVLLLLFALSSRRTTGDRG